MVKCGGRAMNADLPGRGHAANDARAGFTAGALLLPTAASNSSRILIGADSLRTTDLDEGTRL